MTNNFNHPAIKPFRISEQENSYRYQVYSARDTHLRVVKAGNNVCPNTEKTSLNSLG